MPGSTPTNVPSSTPTQAHSRFSGVSALANPSSSRLRVSIRAAKMPSRIPGVSWTSRTTQKKYQLLTENTAPTIRSRTRVRLPSDHAQPANSSAPVMAQPRRLTSSRLSSITPTSLPTVDQSARVVRSTSSPASASGTSPRAVAIASSAASTIITLPMTYGNTRGPIGSPKPTFSPRASTIVQTPTTASAAASPYCALSTRRVPRSVPDVALTAAPAPPACRSPGCPARRGTARSPRRS